MMTNTVLMVIFSTLLLAPITGQTPLPKTKKVLALYFTNVPTTTISIVSIAPEISGHIASALNLQNEDIKLGEFTLGAFVPFMINKKDDILKDSVQTPDTYAKYAKLWKAALLSQNLRQSFKLNNIELKIDVQQFECEQPAGDESDEEEDDDPYLEGDDPVVPSSTLHKELVQAIGDRQQVMQLRLKHAVLEEYRRSWSKFNDLVNGTRSIASSILEVSMDQILFVSLTSGSVVAQFTVHPAPNLTALIEKWNLAVAGKDKRLSSTFSDYDSDFPAVGAIGQGAPSTPGPSGPSDRLVAGVVLGCLAGAALIGGGAASYTYKRYHPRPVDVKDPPTKEPRFDDASPAAGSPGASPDALSNINIEGEITPNPHNFTR